jgi:hypothetical protein
LINERTQTFSKTLAPEYKTLLPTLIEKILKAEEDRVEDLFLATVAKTDLRNEELQIQQDYTQFKPRSHYTDSSLLKTYFIATKWLMREKFYFTSPELTKIILVMGATIQEKDLINFENLFKQIKNLIGVDDDLTLFALQDFLQQQHLTTPEAILKQDIAPLQTQLSALQPQKISSTHYETPGVMMGTGEASMKQTLGGFVLFGEKFTLDSYLFDLTTAGSAEEEFAYKPNMQTALIVPDILEDNALANQLVKLRFSEKADQEKVVEDSTQGFTQLSSYDKVREAAKKEITTLLASGTAVTDNIYHKRL